MLIKGCQRRMIMLRDPKSRYFDTVYFVLKADLPKSSRESDMLREAELILMGGSSENAMPQKPKKVKNSDGVLAYFSGAATVGAAVGAIALAAHLIF